MPARLLLVDGGMRSIAERLRMLAASFDVTVANSLRRTREVLDVTTRDAYDAAVVSHRLPDGEAHEVLSDPRWQLYFPATAVQVTWNSSDVSFDILRKCDFIFPDSLRPSEFLDIVEALVLRRRRPSISELVRRYSKELDLSARQAELLEMFVLGVSNDEAVVRMGCARTTIATHWNRIFEKACANSQREILLQLLRRSCEGDGDEPNWEVEVPGRPASGVFACLGKQEADEPHLLVAHGVETI